MAKSIFKEIIIMLLLCVAILLILGVLFYDYIPSNKVVPSTIAYSTPENIQEEIDEEVMEANKTKITYEITDADLNIYKQSNSYVAGKKDPFSLEENEENTNNGESTSGETTTGSETSDNNNDDNNGDNNDNSDDEIVQTNTNSNPDSTGTFFNETGTK